MIIKKKVKDIVIITIAISSIMLNVRFYNNKEILLKELNNKQVTITMLKKEKVKLTKQNDRLSNKVYRLEKKLKEVLPTPIENVYFNPNNLTETSNANVARLNALLKGTALSGLGASYKQAEEEFGVNAIFLMSLTAEESGWGRSRRAREDNNMSGFEVYNDAAKGARFDSKHESIMVTGKLLSKHYLNPNGKYYKGKDIYAVNKTYCPVNGYTWANNITRIGYNLLK